MNKKRWLAVGIALVIFIVSLVTPKYEIDNSSLEDKLNLKANDFLSGYGEITENVIYEGDSNSRILRLNLDGVIMSGNLPSSLTPGVYSHSFFLEQLDKAYEDETIKAVLFSVNSPGGGVYESAEIRNRILKLKEKGIPIYVSMKNLAASGGYYVSADADKIFATPETWTGSIGVISQVMDFSGLMEKHGVKIHSYASGNMKTMGSSYKAPTEEEIEIWNALINESYDKFVKLIASGRNMDEGKVRRLADGRIYSGKQALDNGLVDELGYEEDVFADLVASEGLENSQYFEYLPGDNPFSSIFAPYLKFSNPNSELAVLESIIDKHANNAPRLYYLYGGRQ